MARQPARSGKGGRPVTKPHGKQATKGRPVSVAAKSARKPAVAARAGIGLLGPWRGTAFSAAASRVGGALLLVSAICLVASAYLPFATYGGQRVDQHVNLASILGQLLVLVVIGGAGVLAVAGRAAQAAAAIAVVAGITGVARRSSRST